MEKQSVNKRIKHIRIIGIIIALLLLILIFMARLVYRSGVFYEKNRAAVRFAETERTGEDNNPSPLIDSSGNTVYTRILTPEGFERADADENGFLGYLRKMELMPDGSPVVLYDGEETDFDPAAVYNLDFDSLQQCADSYIRVYSEYLFSAGKYDEISFRLTNGTVMDYSDWCDGKRLIAFMSFAKMIKLTGNNDSYDAFRAYLKAVMTYAGTKSLEDSSEKIALDSLTIGDMLLHGGTPGHVSFVVDMAENDEGERCFLLAQGFMPARSFHVMKNPAHDDDPWYYASEMSSGTEIKTPNYVFASDELYRLK